MSSKPTVTRAVELEQGQGYSKLRCPSCGSIYLHQRDVRIFTRQEDEPSVVRTTVTDNAAIMEVVANDDSGNPSQRRHGLAIRFECEQCDADLSLALAQHKGETHIEWRIGNPAR